MVITRSRQLLALAGWLAVFAAVVRLRVADFLLTVCLGGFIPGTSIDITPLQAMAISSFAVVLIGYGLLVRARTVHARRMRHYSMRPPISRRQSHLFAAQVAPSDAKETARTRQLSVLFPSLRRRLRDGTMVIATAMLQGFLLLVIGAAKVVIAVSDVHGAFMRATRLTGRRSGQSLSELGQWIDAKLWAADEWVELQFRAGEQWTAKHLGRIETVRVAKAAIDDWTARPVDDGTDSK